MRIDGKGRVNRAEEVLFQFDGKYVRGYAGDTVASALLGKGERLMGRSFKYHRPRGPLTAGSEEPNALITVGSGAHQDPNVRATVQEIYDGLEVFSQNAWPSLKTDVMGINDLAAPFLGAGFYYKTFMWPKAFWEKIYEPIIRRAAGLGGLSGEAHPDDAERAFATCDVLVIGAGPAGLMAALTAAQSGASVILCYEQTEAGGRLLSETVEVDGKPGPIWAAEMVQTLRDLGVRIMTRTTITGVFDGGTYGALERVSHHLPSPSADLPRECFWRIHARGAVLAAGALERPIAHPMNDRPGVMLTSAMASYLNRWGVTPGKRIVLFTNNDSAHATAKDLADAGIETTVVDARSGIAPSGDYLVHAGAEVINTRGHLGLRSVKVRQGTREWDIEADGLGLSGGWNPSVHLTCHMNGRPTWNPEIHAFVPTPGAVPGLEAAGAAMGNFSTHGALKSGIFRARKVLERLGLSPASIKTPVADDTPLGLAPLWAVDAPGRAWLDFQNDVTTKDLRQAAKENFQSVEHMKRYTTQGMATDQGKSSNVGALAVLAEATGRDIPGTGTTTFRPPYVPTAIGTMGAGAKGKGFAPERFTTSYANALQMGAPMIEAGLWYRPSYFPRTGEKTWRDACDREVNMVRDAVGVADVSTLGKIDIQGPDAAKLLDFVYINTFSTLKPGRVRYGVMLREDGFVMDDGTTACIAPDHYVMTTTTAAAGNVMKHLEFVTQALHPEWDVSIISTTEAWAQFSVAGPKARDLINSLTDTKVDNDSFPFMACGAIDVLGVTGRLFRISFSGEHAYEIAVPARYGAALWRDLVGRAELLGGGAYGMEALNVLRIEKGFVTHAEIMGRVTARDIGMGRMISAKKDCIGKAAASRPVLMASREELVGLRPVDPTTKIDAGGHLYNIGDRVHRETDQGYATSACYSPTLQTYMALAFVRDGTARMGERIRFVDRLRGVDTEVEICHPVSLDPEGGRARG